MTNFHETQFHGDNTNAAGYNLPFSGMQDLVMESNLEMSGIEVGGLLKFLLRP